MRQRGIPPQYTSWIRHRVEGRKTMIKFDSFESELEELPRGLDQGCPLSSITFQYYNTDLLDVCNPSNGEEVVAFMDDSLMLMHGKTLQETNRKVWLMMERQGGGLEWSHTHQCEFTIDKFGIMGFSRRREPNKPKKPLTMPTGRYLVYVQGIKVPTVNIHKFIGILLDQVLQWKDKVNQALKKGMKWVTQYHRLVKPSKGISAKYMCQLYMSVVMPRMLYAADLFLIPESEGCKGTKGPIARLEKVQRQASLNITGAMKSAPKDVIDACADLLPFQLLVSKVVHHAATRLASLPTSASKAHH